MRNVFTTCELIAVLFLYKYRSIFEQGLHVCMVQLLFHPPRHHFDKTHLIVVKFLIVYCIACILLYSSLLDRSLVMVLIFYADLGCFKIGHFNFLHQ